MEVERGYLDKEVFIFYLYFMFKFVFFIWGWLIEERFFFKKNKSKNILKIK